MTFTPFSTGILSHVMMMTEIEILKKKISNKTCDIVDGLKTELDKRNFGGDTYQATMVLEEAKKTYATIYTKLSSITSNADIRVVYNNPAFQYLFQIEYG